MRALVRQAMEEGALGVGSSLIYPPAVFAETDELVALTTEAARCGGSYISHMRSEGDRLLESIDELIEISRRSGAPAEIYHLKQVGRANWGKIDAAIAKIEAARAAGLKISADMYTYTAGATGLAASMPPWVQDGGNEAMLKRLKDPATVERIKKEMVQPGIELGKSLPSRRARRRPSRQPDRAVAEAADRQDGRGGRQAARGQPRTGGDRPGARGPGPFRRHLFPDERGQCPAAGGASLGQLRLGRRSFGARRRVPEEQHPSARLWQFRPFPRQICP